MEICKTAVLMKAMRESLNKWCLPPVKRLPENPRPLSSGRLALHFKPLHPHFHCKGMPPAHA